MLMEVDKRKRVLKGFGVFLGGMLVLTLVSRGIYAEGLARVSVEVPERMAVGHVVEVSGNVKQSRELAVNVAEGLRVSEVFVIPGDRVEAGSELFALDLDFLEERIRDKERDVEKLRLQIATVQGNLALAGEEKNAEMSRAGEDAVRAGEEADKALRRAEEDLASARASLQEHLDKNLKNTSDEERQRQEEAYQAWKKRLAEGGEREKSVSDKVKGLQRRKESLEGEIAGLKEKIGELEKKGGENGSEGTEVGTVSGNGLGDGAASGGSGELDALKAQLAEKEAELVQVKKELSEAGWEQEDAAEQLGELQGNAVNKPDFSGEDSAWESWMSTRKSLEEKVQDAEDEKEKALEDAQRNLEDSLRSEQSDSTLGLYQLDLEEAGEELKRLKGILEQEGVVKADASGVVTRVGVAAGEQTSSGASVVFADTARPLQFEVILQKEEKKYVNLGAEAEITLGNSSNMIKATVDYLTEMETSPGSFTALVTLPEGMGTIGQSGMFRVTQQSEMYNFCIPVDALHMDENQRSFVYVLGERSGFLGSELTAEKLMVDVLDKNDKYAALAGGVVDGNSRIICTADREIADGDPVRMKD